VIESILLAVTRVSTFQGEQGLSGATGFFFERDDRLYVVTNRHVVFDEPSGHRPDRIELELHVDAENATVVQPFPVPLYDESGKSRWKQGVDSQGEVDVAVLELDRAALPETLVYRPFTPHHMVEELDEIEVGASLLVVGFPLGFHDDMHHLPVARRSAIASSFGMRFQGKGYFLHDARTHRGTSGAPVVARMSLQRGRRTLPWTLLGVHASRLDVTRDLEQDEALGLNCAWYADIILTLTDPAAEIAPAPAAAAGTPVANAPAPAPAAVAPAPAPVVAPTPVPAPAIALDAPRPKAPAAEVAPAAPVTPTPATPVPKPAATAKP
jgi:hypothetical protein